jgi:hypothetical protein
VGSLLEGFEVGGLSSGILGGVLYGLIAWALSLLIPGKRDD